MCIFYDLNHHFCCFAFTLELIVPFDFVRWFLLKRKSKSRTLWLANGLAEIHLYHMRTIIELVLLSEMFIYYDETLKGPWVQITVHLTATIFFAFYLTPYWTYWTTRQIYREADSNENQKKQS
jgi:hypothetical protein